MVLILLAVYPCHSKRKPSSILAVSFGSLLNVKNLRPHPRPIESEAAFWQGPPSDLHAHYSLRDIVLEVAYWPENHRWNLGQNGRTRLSFLKWNRSQKGAGISICFGYCHICGPGTEKVLNQYLWSEWTKELSSFWSQARGQSGARNHHDLVLTTRANLCLALCPGQEWSWCHHRAHLWPHETQHVKPSHLWRLKSYRTMQPGKYTGLLK